MTIGATGGSGFFLIIIVAFAVLWLLVVRPQKRRQNEQRRMLDELRVGDEVLTAGGIYGTIVRIDEDAVGVEIAPQMEVRIARRAIAGVTHQDEPEVPDDVADEPAVEESVADDPKKVNSGDANRG